MDINIKLTDSNEVTIHELVVRLDEEAIGGERRNFEYQFEYLEDNGDPLTELEFLRYLHKPFGETSIYYCDKIYYCVPITSLQSLEDAGIDNEYPDLGSEFPYMFNICYTQTIDDKNPLEKIKSQLKKLITEACQYEESEGLNQDILDDVTKTEFGELEEIGSEIEDRGAYWIKIISFINFCIEKIEKNPKLKLAYTQTEVWYEHETGMVYDFVASKLNLKI